MNPRPEQPAEGRLITEALDRKGLSIREGARRAGISYGRWRQITNGWQSAGAGNYVPVTGPAGTVARMAAVVGVSAEALEAAGRPDAAKSLRERQEQAPADAELDALEKSLGLDLSTVNPDLRRAVLRRYQRFDERLTRLEREAEERRA